MKYSQTDPTQKTELQKMTLDKVKKAKLIKMGKSRTQWRAEPVLSFDPYSTAMMSFHTASFQLPLNCLSIKRIMLDGVLVWDSSEQGHRRTGVIAGGGRFTYKRSIHDGAVVSQKLQFKDVPAYHEEGDQPRMPVLEVVVVVEEVMA